MKKLMALMLALGCMFAFVGCRPDDALQGTKEDASPSTSAEIEAQASSLTCKRETTPYRVGENLQMSKDQAEFIIQVWNDSTWEYDVSKTAYDFVFRCGDREVRYCYDEGIFNDWTNMKHIVLSPDQKAQVNKVIDNFIVLPIID